MPGLTNSNKNGMVDVDQVRKYVEEHNRDVYTYQYENGRRYASTELGHYYMFVNALYARTAMLQSADTGYRPNDEPEIQRLNQQHHTFTMARGGKLLSAPLAVKAPRVLDIGCGSGIWAIQMADEHPEASIVGMDVSPIQPKNKPENVEWMTFDMEKDWPFPEESFDLIHLSLVHGCVADWPAMMDKIKRYLKPGGYVEQQELALGHPHSLDGTLLPTDAQPRWAKLMTEAGKKRGRPLNLGPYIKGFMTSADLSSVDEQIYKMPIGTWPTDEKQKLIGASIMVQTLNGMEGYTTVLFTKVLGWSLQDTKKMIDDVLRDICDDGKHKYIDLHVAWGRKDGKELVQGQEGP